jgi:hypothetical protein
VGDKSRRQLLLCFLDDKSWSPTAQTLRPAYITVGRWITMPSSCVLRSTFCPQYYGKTHLQSGFDSGGRTPFVLYHDSRQVHLKAHARRQASQSSIRADLVSDAGGHELLKWMTEK